MERRPRFLPDNDGSCLVEVSSRTVQGLALLTPSDRVNEVIVGVLGRALEVSPLGIAGLSFVSNHYHALLIVEDQQQLSRFMHHVQTNLSKEIGRIREWRNGLWSRRYDSIVVSDEPEEQWRRLRYVLANGVKEGLVESPLQWPGVHAARPLVEGGYLEGIWFNRTKEWAARRRGENYERYDYATKYRVGFEPLPCCRHLSPEAYRAKVASLIEEIEREEAEKRGGDPVAGVAAVLRQDPRKPPTQAPPKRSARPRFHAATPQGYKELWALATAFDVQFREAAEALRQTRPGAELGFPPGCFPPALPFVGDPPPPRPPSPPTRRIVELESGEVFRGAVPVVEIPGSLTLTPTSESPSRPGSRSRPPPPGRSPPQACSPALGA